MTYRVAIVGLGPKGFYGLERLVARVTAEPRDIKMDIDVFNRNSFFAAGDIYRTDQPDYLLMNYPNRNIHIWKDRNPKPVVDSPMSLVDWLKATSPSNASPAAFSTRSEVGEYLQDGFRQLEINCPKGVTLRKHVATVVELTPDREKRLLLHTRKSDGKRSDHGPFDQILLATGHPAPIRPISSTRTCVPFIYPVTDKLSSIEKGSTVALKGMGLTFVDAALALTEGRGGKFTDLSGPSPQYHPSGHEPAILLPFSRSGLLMMPRIPASGQWHPSCRYIDWERLYLTRGRRKIDFITEGWPLIQAELQYAYYRLVFDQHGRKLEPVDTPAELTQAIEAFHDQVPNVPRVSWESLTRLPTGTSTVAFLEFMIREAAKGDQGSGWVRCCSRWKYLSDAFNALYSFGGLTPDSHHFFDTKISGHLNRLAYGPPLHNMRKILCLAKAGYIDFSYATSPEVTACATSERWNVQSTSRQTVADVLVDARIPKVNLSRTASSLNRSLLDQGLVRQFRNTDSSGGVYSPGCMELTQEGHPVDAHGHPVEQLTVQGTPTEGITYDNDTLSTQRNDFVTAWAEHVVEHHHRRRTKPFETAYAD